MWRNILAGIQFLTVLPCGPVQKLDTQRTLPYFPLCGLLIGAVLAAVDAGASALWSRPVVAVVDVVALAWITGALHLDGLGDTADGLYGQRPVEKALAIMKDSRIGAIGMVVVVCVLAIKWAGLTGIGNDRCLWLILVPGIARSTVLFGVRALPYGRPDGGTGLSFFDHPLRWSNFWGLALTLGIALGVAGWGGIWIGLGFFTIVTGTLLYYRKKIGCITGDMLGAMIEITEAGLFLLLAAATSIGY